MDPTTCLAEIRELIQQIGATGDDAERDALSEQLTAKVADLDEWLTKGGFPPAQWRSSGPKAWR